MYTGTTLGGARRALAAAALLLGLAGCGQGGPQWSNDARQATDVDRNFPYEVVAEMRHVSVTTPADGSTPPEATVGELDGIFAEFLRTGGRTLAVSAPLAVGAEAAARERLAWVRKRALERGLLPQELSLNYRPGTAGEPVHFDYERYRVVTSDCGDYSKPSGRDADNAAHSNFGCAYQHNLAAMASNPADLQRQRPESATDGDRKSLVLRNYRQGQPTDASLSSQATAPPITRYGQVSQ